MDKINTTFSMPIGALGSTDVLSQILNSIGISGSVLLQEAYCAPWAVSVPPSSALSSLLKTSKGIRVATFHLVVRGQLHVTLDDGEQFVVEQGELIVCFSGQGHVLSQGKSREVTTFQDIMAGAENRFKPTAGDEQASTLLVCGIFLLHDTELNPLMATLPPVLKLQVDDANQYPRLHGVIQLMLQEFGAEAGGNSFVIERYLEILCAETIRTHVDSLPKQASGWLAALKDPVVGRAIEAVHLAPNQQWTVKSIADKVNMSPSRFAARFVACVGEPPMEYVVKWRMYIACRSLKNKMLSIGMEYFPIVE